MEWFDIPNYEGLYQISKCGSVKRIGGGIISDNNSTNKYKKVSLWKNNSRKYVYVHRLLAQLFIANPENKKEINHIDGNKKNNSIENLEWCSVGENALHAYKLGLKKSGELSPVSKLKNYEVDFMRAMYADGLKIQKIFNTYKHRVSFTTVYNILKGKERICQHGMS